MSHLNTEKFSPIVRHFSRFLINMLIVNILSSTLYLPLVLLSLIFSSRDDEGLVNSDAGLVQGLLFKFVSQFIGALSVLSTLCTGLKLSSLKVLRSFHKNIVNMINLCNVSVSNKPLFVSRD